MEPIVALATLPYLVVRLSRERQILEQRLQVLQVDQRQLVVVGELESDVEHAFLGVVKVHQPRQEQRPHLRDGGADRMPLLAEQIPEDDRVGLVVDRVADLLGPRLDPAFGLALLGDAGEIALHVGAEDRHAGVGEALGEALQGDGLAGAGGPGDEAVAVGEPQPDIFRLDASPDIDAVGRRFLGRLAGALFFLRRRLALGHGLSPLHCSARV